MIKIFFFQIFSVGLSSFKYSDRWSPNSVAIFKFTLVPGAFGGYRANWSSPRWGSIGIVESGGGFFSGLIWDFELFVAEFENGVGSGVAELCGFVEKAVAFASWETPGMDWILYRFCCDFFFSWDCGFLVWSKTWCLNCWSCWNHSLSLSLSLYYFWASHSLYLSNLTHSALTPSLSSSLRRPFLGTICAEHRPPSYCGWSLVLEWVAAGVPMVAFKSLTFFHLSQAILRRHRSHTLIEARIQDPEPNCNSVTIPELP